MSSRPSKRRRLTPPQSDDEVASKNAQKQFFKHASNWDLEQKWEDKTARKGKKRLKESSRLPLKFQDGRIQQVTATVADINSLESDEEWLEGGAEDDSGDDETNRQSVETTPDIPEHQQIREAKEELAKAASSLNENPQENAGAFKSLAKIGQSKLPAIQKLTLVTQCTVYKDVIPGYRIRPVSEDTPEEKLSKDVRRLRTWENSLILGYQNYVKDLTRCAKLNRHYGNKDAQELASVAITCACTLLTSIPHFNFRVELLKILVGKCSMRRVDADFNKCLRAIETLFHEDEDGQPSMEATSLLCKMMKAREYQVNEAAINLFLHLRLLSEFSGKASTDSVERGDIAGPNGMKAKSKKEFRTKRERKQLKEQKALQKDLASADAIANHAELEHMQSETLKLVFATYFRILKQRTPHLMGAVLEGLAKYAHLINQNFFGDLLEALKDLIRHSDALEDADDSEADKEEEREDAPIHNPSRDGLLCTVTAFSLLEPQETHNARGDLHLDLSFFSTHLFQTLFSLCLSPDLELSAKSLHLPDPDAANRRTSTNAGNNKINIQTTTVLLLRCLTSILIPHWNSRAVSPLRLSAFAKQLMTASLHTPEKSTRALLALLADVAGTHGRRIAALWNTEERKGDGRFNPLSQSVEGSNPYAATVWEGEMLRRHYCPQVREGVKLLQKSLGGK